MIICICKAIGERTLRDAIRSGARSVDDLAHATGASTDCGTCAEHLQEILAQELSDHSVRNDVSTKEAR